MQTILFVCVHNAGRSQMAEAYFNLLAPTLGVKARGLSAGTAPGGQINPVVKEALEEVHISLLGHAPKLLTPDLAASADRIITMGCGVEADMCPAGTYISEDWGLPDPHGQGIESVRPVRDAVRERVLDLLKELGGSQPATAAEGSR
ncbi:MAG: arsenate reductase ArsC [Actinomycetota bacterium]